MNFRRVIRRWIADEGNALRLLFHGKTVKDRFRGLGRSERNEAKVLLLAFLPTLLTVPFLEKWSDETPLGKSVMVLCGLWMVGVLVAGGWMLFRAIIRASRWRSD